MSHSCVVIFCQNTTLDKMDEYDEQVQRFLAQVHENCAIGDDLDALTSSIFEPSDSEPEDGYKQGGSRPGKAANIDRDIASGAERVFNDYFADEPVFNDRIFRRRFRMMRPLFLRIVEGIRQHDAFFEQKLDALGKMGHSTLQKAVAAIRILALGVSGDAVDEYIRMSDSAANLCLQHFCRAVIEVFGEEYLRSPTPEDIKRILEESAERGFPGMMGSIDCYNWPWENCPKAWSGMYTGKKGTSIVLEAACSYDLWIWHAFFGLPGSMNDLNVLQQSTLLQNLVNGKFPLYNFKVDNTEFSCPYWLADGIYPDWAVFVKTIAEPVGEANKFYSKMQEGARKDIERAFGVLQKRFQIVKNPGRMWRFDKISDVMMCCIILHNMIVEDERSNHVLLYDIDYEGLDVTEVEKIKNKRRRLGMMKRIERTLEQRQNNPTNFQFSIVNQDDLEILPGNCITQMVAKGNKLFNTDSHFSLKVCLVQHLWKKFKGEM